MSVNQRLKEHRIQIPSLSAPVGNYLSAVRTGDLIYTSGQLPMVDGRLMFTGRVGKDVSIENAQRAARAATLNALGAVKGIVGDLEKIKKVVRLNGYVCSALDFNEQHRVMNAASDLLVDIFGEEVGKHSRIAIGCLELPLVSCLEIDLICQVS